MAYLFVAQIFVVIAHQKARWINLLLPVVTTTLCGYISPKNRRVNLLLPVVGATLCGDISPK
ncbi:hypothetical protein CEX98_17785 [Pseudoalteromonas piscicida]|uniref:Uncharacterized protein n=1 Tax=Pseudoalteromonas piscicida TaxID=43662 RepID=A0A2A5JMJ1_PSEO7|nr:hypothetical protein CEX98_17785 [Pseudoalteromonas piscicida]